MEEITDQEFDFHSCFISLKFLGLMHSLSFPLARIPLWIQPCFRDPLNLVIALSLALKLEKFNWYSNE
jgi:hypothetical protein